MSDVLSVLFAAREAVSRGWCQGTFRDSEGRVCAVGAIRRAAGGDESAVAPGITVNRALDTFIEANDIPWLVSSWNDAPNRTQNDVVAAFDRAIELAQSEGR